MSLVFYGGCILGAVLGGAVVLVLYSLLVMGKRSDECPDQPELKMFKTDKYAPPRMRSEKSEKLLVPGASDLYHGGIT
jgi:hypothetical protein